jgi:hypothetical protein
MSGDKLQLKNFFIKRRGRFLGICHVWSNRQAEVCDGLVAEKGLERCAMMDTMWVQEPCHASLDTICGSENCGPDNTAQLGYCNWRNMKRMYFLFSITYMNRLCAVCSWNARAVHGFIFARPYNIFGFTSLQVSQNCAFTHASLLTKGYRKGSVGTMLPIFWLYFQKTIYRTGFSTVTLFFR